MSRVDGAELQDDLIRFEGRFAARLASGFSALADSNDPAVRVRATRDELAFISAALDIAVGTEPDVDLLDMVTLVALGRVAMESRWRFEEHGDAVRLVEAAFQDSLDDIAAVARNVLPPEMENELYRVIAEWRAENPAVEDVASVRLSAYAEYREGKSAGSRSASGLFSAFRGAARTADNAVLLGERALYVAQRLPFLVRMHARVGTSEIVSDLGRNLAGLGVALSSDKQKFVLDALAGVQALVASTEKPLAAVERMLAGSRSRS